MRFIPHIIVVALMVLGTTGVHAQESNKLQCGTLTAVAPSLSSKVETKVNELLTACEQNDVPQGGVLKTSGPEGCAEGNANSCAWVETTATGLGTVFTARTNLQANTTTLTASKTGIQVYFPKSGGGDYAGQVRTIAFESDKWVLKSGVGYASTCASAYREANDQVYVTKQAVMKKEGDKFNAETYKTTEKLQKVNALRDELVGLCAGKYPANTPIINQPFGMEVTAVEAAVDGGSMDCGTLIQLYNLFNGQGVCMDDQANYTFTTGGLGSTVGVEGLIGRIMGIMAASIGSVAMLVMMVGGLMMVAAGGNEDMVTRGKSTLTYGIIGIIVVFMSYLLITFVQSLFF